jgi:hypothetical protein
VPGSADEESCDAGSTKKDPNRLRRPINAFLIWFHSHYKVAPRPRAAAAAPTAEARRRGGFATGGPGRRG